MLVLKDNTRIYFNSDEDFYNFAVVPKLNVIKQTDAQGNESSYCDFDLSNEYKYAVANGIKFIIKDEDSQIYKNQCVSYRTITKPVVNLVPYFKLF